MKRKILFLTVFLAVLTLFLTFAFAQPPAAVKNLKAENAVNSVVLTWSPSSTAHGYLVFRKMGTNPYNFIAMTSKTNYRDYKMSSWMPNYYRVYPYRMVNGKRVVGTSNAYVTGKAAIYMNPVGGPFAKGERNRVYVNWVFAEHADGYFLFRKIGNNGRFTFIKLLPGNKNIKYYDMTASINEFNYYKVYPYKIINGKRMIGEAKKYAYAKAYPGPIDQSVTGLKARPGLGHNTVTWNKLEGMDGYLVYRLFGEDYSFTFLNNVTTNSYEDFDFSDYNGYRMSFYRIYPYKRVNGATYTGKSTTYAYAKPMEYDVGFPRHIRGFQPQNLSNTNVWLTWDAIPGVSGYAVQMYERDDADQIYYGDGYKDKIFTKSTRALVKGVSSKKVSSFRVVPYKLVKGRRVLGRMDNYSKANILAYATKGTYYTGNYLVGSDIPVGTYKVWKDTNSINNMSVSYFIHVFSSGGEQQVVLNDTAQTVKLNKGDMLLLQGAYARKQ